MMWVDFCVEIKALIRSFPREQNSGGFQIRWSLPGDDEVEAGKRRGEGRKEGM